MARKNKVYLKRTFSCAVDELFDWLVEPELIIQWFGPPQFNILSISNNLEIGGTYEIKMQNLEGEFFDIIGIYQEIYRPVRLVYSLEYRPIASPKSRVIFELEAISSGECNLFFTQEFHTIPLNMKRRLEAWNHMFDRLTKKASPEPFKT